MNLAFEDTQLVTKSENLDLRRADPSAVGGAVRGPLLRHDLSGRRGGASVARCSPRGLKLGGRCLCCGRRHRACSWVAGRAGGRPGPGGLADIAWRLDRSPEGVRLLCPRATWAWWSPPAGCAAAPRTALAVGGRGGMGQRAPGEALRSNHANHHCRHECRLSAARRVSTLA